MIIRIYKEEHPLVAKFNQNLVEALNSDAESPDRTARINELCEQSTLISETHFGKDSIYLVRQLYTLYTAKLHEEEGQGYE